MGCLFRKLMGLLFWVIVILLGIYSWSYVQFRKEHLQDWDKDGRGYVIFPKDEMWKYYFYRPASILDENLTETGAHIGPHQ